MPDDIREIWDRLCALENRVDQLEIADAVSTEAIQCCDDTIGEVEIELECDFSEDSDGD